MLKRFNSLYARLLLILFVVLLPVELGQSIIYRFSDSFVRSELTASASSHVLFTRNEMETAVRQITDQLDYLLQNLRVKDYLSISQTISAPDYYVLVRDIEDLLYFLSTGNPFLSEVSIYYPTMDRVLSSKKQVRYVPRRDVRELFSDFTAQGSLLTQRQSILSVGYSGLTSRHFDLPYYFVSAELNMNQVNQLLKTFDLEGNRHLLMLNHRAECVYGDTQPFQDSLDELFDLFAPDGSQSVRSIVWTLSGVRYFVVGCDSDYLGCSFLQLIPYDTIFAFPGRLQTAMVLFTALAVVLFLLYAVTLSRMVQRPVGDLTHAFQQATGGDFSVRLPRQYLREFDIIAHSFNHMSQRIQELIRSNYESTLLRQQAELKQLMAQINPHFLYNTFFILRHSIKSGAYPHAEKLAGYLGSYFRYITDQSQSTLTLAEEYEHALTYLKIQLMRLEEFSQVDIPSLPEEYRDVKVPRLILQPIFENAIEHGIPSSSGSARLRLGFERGENTLTIHLEDNGDRLSAPQIEDMRAMLASPTDAQAQHALVNTHRRLVICYGPPCGLTVSRSELGGLHVAMTIGLTLNDQTMEVLK